MARASRSLALALLVLAPLACADGGTDPLLPDGGDARSHGVEAVTVMTQNVYLGADIDPLLGGGDPATAIQNALAQLQQTNFMARAYALAGQIVAQQPAVVGLQEVSRYQLPEGLGLPTVIPYLDILMFAIADLGGSYTVAAFQENVQVALPFYMGETYVGDIVYTDGDAILARSDVVFDEAMSDHFDAQQTLSVAGTVFENLRGWNAVRVTTAGQTFRFVNTHLEIQPFRDVQEQQAQELVELFADDELPVIMVGDFNSAANPHPLASQATESYHTFRNAGFADLWLREPHSNEGLTCCQAPALDNTESQLHSRLDLVLVRYGSAGFGGQSWVDVLGEEESDIIDLSDVMPGYTLWPSDHASVVAKLWTAPGLIRSFGD